MLTMAAFRHLAAAYGADLARWPEAQREEARALLARTPDAYAWLHQEAGLDAALAQLAPPKPGTSDLARLRAGVAARMDAPRARQSLARQSLVLAWPNWGWLAAGAGGALAAGLLVGLLSATPPASTGLLAMLQPAALPVLVD
jgi:hypothetical protein